MSTKLRIRISCCGIPCLAPTPMSTGLILRQSLHTITPSAAIKFVTGIPTCVVACDETEAFVGAAWHAGYSNVCHRRTFENCPHFFFLSCPFRPFFPLGKMQLGRGNVCLIDCGHETRIDAGPTYELRSTWGHDRKAEKRNPDHGDAAHLSREPLGQFVAVKGLFA